MGGLGSSKQVWILEKCMKVCMNKCMRRFKYFGVYMGCGGLTNFHCKQGRFSEREYESKYV